MRVFFSAAVTSLTTCEHSTSNTMSIACPGNSRIVINQANYGRFDTSTCCFVNGFTCTNTNCLAPGALSIVKNQCVFVSILYNLDKLVLSFFSYSTLHVAFRYYSSLTSKYGFISSRCAVLGPEEY